MGRCKASSTPAQKSSVPLSLGSKLNTPAGLKIPGPDLEETPRPVAPALPVRPSPYTHRSRESAQPNPGAGSPGECHMPSSKGDGAARAPRATSKEDAAARPAPAAAASAKPWDRLRPRRAPRPTPPCLRPLPTQGAPLPPAAGTVPPRGAPELFLR